jgi:hypothetical protein
VYRSADNDVDIGGSCGEDEVVVMVSLVVAVFEAISGELFGVVTDADAVSTEAVSAEAVSAEAVSAEAVSTEAVSTETVPETVPETVAVEAQSRASKDLHSGMVLPLSHVK